MAVRGLVTNTGVEFEELTKRFLHQDGDDERRLNDTAPHEAAPAESDGYEVVVEW